MKDVVLVQEVGIPVRARSSCTRAPRRRRARRARRPSARSAGRRETTTPSAVKRTTASFAASSAVGETGWAFVKRPHALVASTGHSSATRNARRAPSSGVTVEPELAQGDRGNTVGRRDAHRGAPRGPADSSSGTAFPTACRAAARRAASTPARPLRARRGPSDRRPIAGRDAGASSSGRGRTRVVRGRRQRTSGFGHGAPSRASTPSVSGPTPRRAAFSARDCRADIPRQRRLADTRAVP